MAAPSDVSVALPSDTKFFVNGKQHSTAGIPVGVSLGEYLRYHATPTVTSVKISCAQGGCGACTVSVTEADKLGGYQTRSVSSCLVPVHSLAGAEVTTSEGIGNERDGVHPVQQRIAMNNGTQCGYCTPGQVMGVYSLLRQTDGKPSPEEVDRQLDGNICRCTGYRPIMGAARSFACKEKCHGREWVMPAASHALTHPPAFGGDTAIEDLGDLLKAYDPKDDPKPPAAVVDHVPAPATAVGPDGKAYTTVTSVDQLLEEFKRPGRVISAGNTGTAFWPHPEGTNTVVDVRRIPELNGVELTDAGISAGAATTISNLIAALDANTEASPSSYGPLVVHMRRIANTNVRNMGTWAGNVWMAKTKGFGSDMATLLAGAGATIDIITVSTGARSSVSMETFLAAPSAGGVSDTDTLVVRVLIPKATPGEHLRSYRVATRYSNSHAWVNACMRATLDEAGNVTASHIVFGCVNHQHAITLAGASGTLSGPLTQATFEATLAAAHEELEPLWTPLTALQTADDPAGKEAFRRSCVGTFLFKFFKALQEAASGAKWEAPIPPPASYRQDFEVPEGRLSQPKITALTQATGEAKYTDDMPNPPGGLFGAFVGTTVAAGKFLSADWSKALAAPGVVDYVAAGDIPGANDIGFVPSEEPLFVPDGGDILHLGQPIGMIVAKTYREARAAVALVELAQEAVEPVVSIDDALANESFLMGGHHVGKIDIGDAEGGLAAAANTVEGVFRQGGQHAFPMEKQVTLAIPDERDRMIVWSATQFPELMRAKMSAVLGIAGSFVSVNMRRAGGGFGPKVSRSLPTAGAVCVAAYKLRTPVRMTLTIQDEHQTVGGRHPVRTAYKAAYEADGAITALKLESWVQGGCTHDLTGFLTGEVNDNIPLVYALPNLKIDSHALKTNVASHTNVRGFGQVQAVAIMETVIEAVAAATGLPAHIVRERNMVPNTPDAKSALGKPFGHYNMHRVWAELKESSDFEARYAAITEFNKHPDNKFRKRGISMAPVCYAHGLGFAAGTSALVNINGVDGTVSVHHSSCEIGQGVNTKVAQVVAMELGCPIESVYIHNVSTDTLPNGMLTGGSISSETACAAAIAAARILNSRLEPVRESIAAESGVAAESVKWEELCPAANSSFGNKTLLSAVGDFLVDGKRSADPADPSRPPFPAGYHTFGASVSEVEVDVLSGEVTAFPRCDILFDIGHSINPTIDVGQLEGGFVYGQGYFLTEDVYTDAEGVVQAADTWEYKPPTNVMVPRTFNVAFLRDSPFLTGILRSKAVAEPPCLMAYTMVGAIRHALSSVQADLGTPAITTDLPMTPDRVREMAGVSDAHLKLA